MRDPDLFGCHAVNADSWNPAPILYLHPTQPESAVFVGGGIDSSASASENTGFQNPGDGVELGEGCPSRAALMIKINHERQVS